jgi:hypothetical protein
VPREASTELAADLAEREVDLVVYDDDAVERDAERSAGGPDRVPGIIHERLGQHHRHSWPAGFPLLADALITLAWRVYKRHSLLDGHSEHVYQILMHGGVSHAEVAFMYWTAMAVCGGIGFLVAEDPGVAAWVALASMAFLAIVVSAVVRRFASRRNVGGV